MVSPPLADWMAHLHPLRLQYELFSNANPIMAPVATLAEQVRGDRRPVPGGNPFFVMQEAILGQIVAALDAWGNVTEAVAERTFLALYGSPRLQTAVGIDPAGRQPLRKAAKSPLHKELLQRRITELKAAIPSGGLRAVVIRGILYAGITRGGFDVRGFEALRRIREAHTDLSLSAVKTLVREQYNMLLIDQDAALAAIPSMLPRDTPKRRKAFDLLGQFTRAPKTWLIRRRVEWPSLAGGSELARMA
jgi:hypothetical protein